MRMFSVVLSLMYMDAVRILFLADSSNEVIETQLKAFMEDFNMERQEKEQIAQQKRQMHDENNKLRVQLAA